jgi:predicted chitinase
MTPLFLLCVVLSYGQNYAVRSSVQLVPPYSVYLSDYATGGNQKLRVILQQGDLSRPVYQLRLVMSVELNGRVIMRTSRFFNPAPITLDPGVPTIIAGAELAPYVDSRNIDFIGYSKDQYEKTKALPEGSYQITFTAYDYRRQDQQVSNAGSAFYYLAKNEPPLINYPACGSKIPLKTPQQIVFSWMPRNTSSPTSAQETEYEFSLYETRPTGRNPNDVVLTSPPVFRLRTDYTQIVYGPSEPMLLDDMVYVWRVQAIDRSGKDAFRNNGYSEVCTFKYGGTDPNFDIGVVRGLNAIGETDQRGKVWWEKGNFDAYRVNYKKTGSEWQWFFNEVTNTEFKIFDLEPDNEYEVRVQGKKDGYYSPFTEIIKFRTREKILAQCGDPAVVANELGPPLQQALTGMTFMASDHEATFIEVQNIGQPGWFKGTGSVFLPMLGATYYVYFDRLYVNENREATGGKMHVASEGIAKMIEDQLAAQKDKKKTQQQQANQQQWAGTDFYEKIIDFNYAIDDITVDTSGNLAIKKDGGQTVVNTEVPAILAKAPEKAVIIQDKNGDQYVVQKDKTTGQTKVTKVEGGGLSPGNGNSSDKLTEMIIVSLKKYQKAIDDYQASNKEVQPGKGGGPSLFAWELETFLADLPECLVGSEDRLDEIESNIVSFLAPQSTKLEGFVSTIKTQLEEISNVTQERIDAEVCSLLSSGDNEEMFASVKKGKLVATISDTVMIEGNVFIYSGVNKQMKVKYEVSDTTKTKIPYQITIIVESSNKTMNYPKTGYDTLIYNQFKEVVLDSIPQGKYILVCKIGKKEYRTTFFIRRQKLEITKEQLKAVFTNTDLTTLETVAKALNNYGKAFGIITKDRMTNFLAQTGHESGGFKDPKGESGCYSSANAEGWRIWFRKTWAEPPFGTNCDTTLNVFSKGSKKLKWTALACDSTDKKCVKVPDEYICGSANSLKGDALTKKLFSYVYQCEGGNGDNASADGYTYRGHGAIQLTWKKNYEAFDKWLKSNYKDKYKDVVSNPKSIDEDKELFILSAMWFWNTNNLNSKADNGKFDEITKAINSAGHGKAERLKYLESLKKQIK